MEILANTEDNLEYNLEIVSQLGKKNVSENKHWKNRHMNISIK